MGDQMIRVAFIGAGNMAYEHIKAFHDSSEVMLVGIHSRTINKAVDLAARFNITHVCRAIEDLYYATKADVVVISVSVLETEEICKKAFLFPWKVLVEKPVGHTFESASRIASEADRTGCDVFVALNRRHYSSTQTALKELENNHQNRIVDVFDQEDSNVALGSGHPRVVVENWMYANSIHLIDYFSLLCRGQVQKIEHIIRWNPSNPNAILAKLDFSSGDVGVYRAIWNAPGPWSVAVTTKTVRLEMRPLEVLSRQLHGSRKIESIETNSWDLCFKPGLRMQVEEVIKAVRGKKNSLPTLCDSLVTMRLIKEIYEV